jgi:hypothetical protein
MSFLGVKKRLNMAPLFAPIVSDVSSSWLCCLLYHHQKIHQRPFNGN